MYSIRERSTARAGGDGKGKGRSHGKGNQTNRMVTATEDPNTLRVSFFLQETPLSRSEVVCNVKAVEDGIDIEYLYHDQQMRTISGGTWSPPQESQMRLTPILIAQIEAGVMSELWNTFRRKVRVMEMR